MSNLTDTVCKFCKQHVLFDTISRRVLEKDGQTPHSDNCPNRKAYYSQRAFNTRRQQRDKRKP